MSRSSESLRRSSSQYRYNVPDSHSETAIAWRVSQLERQVERLSLKVDRLTWALTLAALSFAGATVMLMVTILTHAHTPSP